MIGAHITCIHPVPFFANTKNVPLTMIHCSIVFPFFVHACGSCVNAPMNQLVWWWSQGTPEAPKVPSPFATRDKHCEHLLLFLWPDGWTAIWQDLAGPRLTASKNGWMDTKMNQYWPLLQSPAPISPCDAWWGSGTHTAAPHPPSRMRKHCPHLLENFFAPSGAKPPMLLCHRRSRSSLAQPGRQRAPNKVERCCRKLMHERWLHQEQWNPTTWCWCLTSTSEVKPVLK